MGHRIESPAGATRAFPSQHEIVEAVICLLTELGSGAAGKPEYPDEVNRKTRDVDAVVRIGMTNYAIEHTRVEQFEGATKERQFLEGRYRDFQRMGEALRARLPSGAYELQLIGPIVAKGDLLRALLDDLANAVCAVAPTLATPPPPGPNIRKGTIRHGTGKITYRLVRGFDPTDGAGPELDVLFMRRFRGSGEREARDLVLRRLLAAKCVKLGDYRAKGFSTVLVLENTAFMPSPYRLLELAEMEIQSRFAETTDILVVVSCEDDVWDLQYVRKGEGLSSEAQKHNWWVWDPLEHRINQRDWEGTSRRAGLDARSPNAANDQRDAPTGDPDPHS